MTTTKIIKFYKKNVYGKTIEYIHPDNSFDGQLIQLLTNQIRINIDIRSAITQLSNNTIQFKEVIAPN
jgi:hypothetical protein